VGCRALPEFGRTKLLTKKVGNKIVMGGEGWSKKSWTQFFQNELFFQISRYYQTPRATPSDYSIKKNKPFFRAPLDE
jgi:hypothetical protein